MIVYEEYDRRYVADPVKFPWAIESSKIIEASLNKVDEAKLVFLETGKCDHSFIVDTCNWLYDFRTCAVCGKGLGTV